MISNKIYPTITVSRRYLEFLCGNSPTGCKYACRTTALGGLEDYKPGAEFWSKIHIQAAREVVAQERLEASC